MSDFSQKGPRLKAAKPEKRGGPESPERLKKDISDDFSRWPECKKHAHFQNKGVDVPPGLRMIGNNAAVPVFAPDGRMISWQTIGARGDKRFKNGNRLGRGYYFRIGGEAAANGGGRIYITEGLAAACSVAETGLKKAPVFCAFSKKNMDDLADRLLEKHPKKKIVLCLANDGNKTRAPRRKHERLIVLCPAEKGDFNDHRKVQAEREKLLRLAPVYERARAERPKKAPAAELAEALAAAGKILPADLNDDYFLFPAREMTIISGKDVKSRLKLVQTIKAADPDPIGKGKRPVSVRSVSRRRAAIEKRAARLQFYAGLFQEKGELTAGEIVKKAMEAKEAGGRGLSRAQVFRRLKALEADGFLIKSGKRPSTKYRVAGGLKAWAGGEIPEARPAPETIEIESGEPENESVAATPA